MAQDTEFVFTKFYRNHEPEITQVRFSKYPKDAVLAAIMNAMVRDGGSGVSVHTSRGAYVMGTTLKTATR